MIDKKVTTSNISKILGIGTRQSLYNYIKSRQYLSNWSGIKEFMIIIYFKYTPNDAANTYLKKVSEQLKEENIFIKLVIN